MGLHEKSKFERKPTKAGHKRTSIETRQQVWDFWHSNSTRSTITSCPAKIKVCDERKIQIDLVFVDSVNIIKQHKKLFYESGWMVTTLTIKQLYEHYVKENPTNAVSLQTFFTLKLFYVHSATSKDIEVCVCKKHLHAQWAVQALIDCSRKQHINLRTITS